MEKIKEMENKIKELEREVQFYKELSEKLQQEKDQLQEVKFNERGAGRKSRFTEEEKKSMKICHEQGLSIRKIASKYNCSPALVHKFLKEI